MTVANCNIKKISPTQFSAVLHYITNLHDALENLEIDLEALCAEYVKKDIVVSLLALVQSIERDPDNDFQPVLKTKEDEERVKVADAALLLLTCMHELVINKASEEQWQVIGIDENSGLSIYQNEKTGLETELPEWAGQNWAHRLLLNLPLLIIPQTSKKKKTNQKVEWMAKVLSYHRSGDDPLALLVAKDNNLVGDDFDHFCIFDMKKSDSDGNTAIIREIIKGPWKGPYSSTYAAWDTATSVGNDLEDWTSVSIAGLTLPALAQESDVSIKKNNDVRSVLILGSGGGLIPNFLNKHCDDIKITTVEPSISLKEQSSHYFNWLDDNVILSNPLDFVVEALKKKQSYDVIHVNFSGPESSFPKQLLSELFFVTLCSLLNFNNNKSRILVHVGIDEDEENIKNANKVISKLKTFLNNGFKQNKMHNAAVQIFNEQKLRGLEEEGTEVPEVLQSSSIIMGSSHISNLTVENWCENVFLPTSGAMDYSHAQNTEVIKLPKFLSHEEIQEIHQAAREAKKRGAGIDVRSRKDKDAPMSWDVVYLQTHNIFDELLPNLKDKILKAVKNVDKDSNWNLIKENYKLGCRVVEFHSMGPGGHLPDPRHYDLDSLITIDMMLTQPNVDYQGGHLQTEELDGSIKRPEFGYGDAMVFVSHKPHHVTKVTDGLRNVLVVEIWKGRDCSCPHRCEAYGPLYCRLDKNCKIDATTISNQNSIFNLPFRLGSVSNNKNMDVNDNDIDDVQCDVISLLWEPYDSSMLINPDSKKFKSDFKNHERELDFVEKQISHPPPTTSIEKEVEPEHSFNDHKQPEQTDEWDLFD